MEKITILELFSGYGTASFALKRLSLKELYFDFEVVGYSDIDKYANQCFQQNHGGKELGDVTDINPWELDYFDLLTAGFPCQSFSVAGKGLGELDTRGTLFNEIIRIAEVKKPRWMLLENVKGLTNKNHAGTFNKILSELGRIGYYVKWKVLNTKDFGIPQNRERVWFVCFREQEDYVKFEFPEKEELKIFLKDILEENVDEKYYLSNEAVKRLLNNGQGFRSKINPEVGSCLFSSMHKINRGMDIIQLNNPTHSNNRVYSDEGLSPSLNTMGGGNRQPFILDLYNHKIKKDGVSICLSDPCHNNLRISEDGFRIRKLTPKECFRLQGFLNDEVNLEGLSNTQQYKLAGNGQSVNVVAKIFERMFNPQ